MSFLFGIKYSEIDDFWPRIRHLVEKPLARTGAIKDFSPDDILKAIRERDMQCWIAHEDGKILVVGITEIMCFPRRKVLGVPFVGAEPGRMEAWLEHFETLKAFGRHHGCKAVRVWGRKGWEKVLSPDVVRLEADIEL